MRRSILFLGTMLVMLLVAGGVALAATIVGTSDSDELFGTPGNDNIYAYEGEDWIHADNWKGNGSDYINGGPGPDHIDSDYHQAARYPGNDTVIGHKGNDIIDGGPGKDNIYGSWNNDTIDGGPGEDKIYGGDGSGDRCYGGDGHDYLDPTCEVRVQ